MLTEDLVLEELSKLPDNKVNQHLSSLRVIGVWTVEMLMTFSTQRSDIMSSNNLVIYRDLRMPIPTTKSIAGFLVEIIVVTVLTLL
ncbi:MAG: hypothetical protein AMR96_06915 [Candidatus Adiutrix intracellularis]|jgi:3-methyladenine DNA glycosylase/8-oxoguanine DNA glycosylase|nr:MAG: hypothetical protein AMR96_06915 [Candidatus Adiutrix intracellularis]